MGRLKHNRCCPRCGSDDILLQDVLSEGINCYICLECDKEFETGGKSKKHFDEYRISRQDDEFDDFDEERESW